jgi:hypothetical protein
MSIGDNIFTNILCNACDNSHRLTLAFIAAAIINIIILVLLLVQDGTSIYKYITYADIGLSGSFLLFIFIKFLYEKT